ncbi:hypothetical protein TSUD_403710 [Trifolium subterraneum]|uniref:Integrase catalytic domain-containing protein n=1 Tax=Trifolium subterraneum TaxID=3900 RepID=A0A2Z6NT34_TRISU|nr:hypothetical protein TSUD_403710 [Trifolium subterraneum]
MVTRRGATSSYSMLGDIDPNPQLVDLLASVRVLQEQNLVQQQRNEEHQRLQEEARIRETELRLQLEERERELRQQMEARERELRQQIDLLRNNVAGAETTRMMPKVFQPFSEEIQAVAVPRHFREPTIDSCDGSGDPQSHVSTFQTQMFISGADDALSCKIFAGTLKDVAHKWIAGLPTRSVTSFEDLATHFVAQFAANSEKPFLVADLFDVRQRPTEPLKNYHRFNSATLKVTEPNEDIFVMAFEKGLSSGTFSEALTLRKANSMNEIRMRAEKHIEAEEIAREKGSREIRGKDQTTEDRRERTMKRLGRDGVPRNFRQKQRDRSEREAPPRVNPRDENFTPLTKRRSQILKEVMNTQIIKRPPPNPRPMGDEPGQWCDYHRAYGHNTDNCRTLRMHIEKLIQEGHLGRYVQGRGGGHHDKRSDKRNERGVVNTIAGGFSGSGATNSARKRYLRSSLSCNIVGAYAFKRHPQISFTFKDFEGIYPHDDDPLVVSVVTAGFQIKRAMVDIGSSTNVLFWEVFEKLGLPKEVMREHRGALLGFSGESVEIIGYVDLRTTFGEGENAKTIMVKYIIVDGQSSYNLILGRPALNGLGAIVSTSHLCIKYPLEGDEVGVIKADQSTARKCYEDSLRNRRAERRKIVNDQCCNFLDLDPRDFNREEDEWRPRPAEEVKEIQIGAEPGERTKRAIEEETQKLANAKFIREVKYPTWLANVVMVKKASGKWRMCTDYTDLNKVCPKDAYPLPSIDQLVDNASGYGLLSFMDAYSGYNQIRMHPEDEEKTAFMTDRANFCYKVMPFGLKNAGATYQRLMDKVFKYEIGKTIEVYVDDMVVKSAREEDHQSSLSKVFRLLRKHDIKLNPEKCSFGVQAGKFLGFMLTRRGIEVNPEKCKAIMEMKSPANAKDVQKLTGRIASLTRFLSCSADKNLPFFQLLRKNEKFCWTEECEGAFQNSSVADFCKEWGIQLSFTSVEHPQANGQAESTNKVILQGLKKRLEAAKRLWVEELPMVMWSYHTTPHSSTQETPFKMMYGSDVMIPIAMISRT